MSLLLAMLLALSPAGAGPASVSDPVAGADAAFQMAVLAELRGLDPDAAAAYAQAEAAWKLGDLAGAGEGYGVAHQRLPDSPHPLRRHCGVMLQAGMRAGAITHCRAALEREQAPENQVALAAALLAPALTEEVSPSELEEARALLETARQADSDDLMNARLRCHLAEERGAAELLADCAADLQRLAPDEVQTWFLSWRLAMEQGDPDAALAALDRAQAAGMSADDLTRFRGLTVREQGPAWSELGPRAAAGAGLGLLVFLGIRLWRRRG